MFGAINVVKAKKESLYKAVPWLVLLQKGTRQWQKHCKEDLLVELFV